VRRTTVAATVPRRAFRNRSTRPHAMSDSAASSVSLARHLRPRCAGSR